MKFAIVAMCCAIGYCIGLFVQKKSLEQLKFFQAWNNYVLALKNNLGGKCLPMDLFNKEFCCDNDCAEFCKMLETQRAPKFLDSASALQFRALATLHQNKSKQQMLQQLEQMQPFVGNLLLEKQKQSSKQKSVYCQVGFLFGFLVGMLFV